MNASDQYLDCLCRTCLNEIETSSNSTNTTPQQQRKSIFDRIEECGALQIAELLSQAVPEMEIELSDELPKKICVKCLQQLLNAYSFQKMCIQSEERLREMVSKRLTDLKMSTIKAVMKRELGTNDTDSYPLMNFLSSTLENLQHPSIQDPLLEAIEQVIESETAKSSGAEHLDNIEKLLDACKDAQDNFNEVNEDYIEYSDGGTIHSTISVTNDAEDNFNEVNKNERIQEGGSDIEYSDGGTVHSTISVTNDELLPIDSEEQQENVMNISHDEDRPYECSYCPKRFRTTSHRNQHKQIHEAAKREACDICDKKFLRKGDLKNHKLIHTGEKPHKCDVCEKRFIRIQELRYHMGTHTGEKPYKCKYCEIDYLTKSHLVRHLRSRHCQQPATEESPQQLEIQVKENVKEHCLGHDEDIAYECPYCLQRFRSTENLIRHTQLHESTKPEACDTCGKQFLRKWDLKIHKLRHNGEKPHKCDVCEKRFIRIQHLRSHMYTHTGERPYKCKYCQQGYTSKNALTQHLRNHLGENVFRCCFCPLAFPSGSELRSHFITHKNEDPETRERNLIALREEQARLRLHISEKKTQQTPAEESQQQLEINSLK